MGAAPPGALARSQISSAGAGIAAYQLAFQVSPIILQGGIAASAQGGLLPIIALYGQTNLFTGTQGANGGPPRPPPTANQFFAQYRPLPGSTLISNAIGQYPFANQQVAANAIIQQPLTLSMLMIAPVNQQGGYLSKLATFTGLQQSLEMHNGSGGWYSVATPAFVFNDLLMTAMTDISHDEGGQDQVMWQLDFVKPLITLSAAAAAQSHLMSTITNGGAIVNPTWSGQPGAVNPAAISGLTGAIAKFGGSFPSSSASTTISGGGASTNQTAGGASA